jgi:hypothetical protein
MAQEAVMALPPQSALFPKAWKYYNAVVAAIGALLVLLNTLAGAHLFSPEIDKWIAFAINIVVAVLVWLNDRRRQLYPQSHTDEPDPPDKST